VINGCVTKVINPPIESRVFFPKDLACREVQRSGARLLECIMPPKSEVNEFIIVGKKGWIDREETLIDCQQSLEKAEFNAPKTP
jgi:hypothetical protein